MVKSSFFCIQPIYINPYKLIDIYRLKFEMLQQIRHNNVPHFFKDLQKFYGFSDLIDLESIYKNEISSFNNSFSKNIYLDLNRFSNQIESRLYLFLDVYLFSFLIIYEINIFYKDEEEYLNIIKLFSKDYYLKIRSTLVQENFNDVLPPYMENIRHSVLNLCVDFLNTYSNKNIFSRKNVELKPNTGNIVHFLFISPHINMNQKKELFKITSTINQLAERLKPFFIKPISLSDSNDQYMNILLFNGRFHTFIFELQKNSITLEISRYLPLIIQLQKTWFFITQQIIPIIDEYHKKTFVIKTADEKFIEQLEILLSRLEYMLYQEEKFMQSIESDKDTYKNLQAKWNIDTMLTTIVTHIKNFKAYIKQINEKKLIKQNKKQNNILFFISVLQFLSLVSVWNDYLNLISEETFHKKYISYLDIFFDKYLESINLFLPIVFILFLIFIYLLF